jgi:putative intracellular protease/amidase
MRAARRPEPSRRATGARTEVARRTASVCTGGFLLAAAGLLDRRRAVTHWKYCDLLARRYPAAKVELDRILAHDGDVWSSAGVTAGVDLSSWPHARARRRAKNRGRSPESHGMSRLHAFGVGADLASVVPLPMTFVSFTPGNGR